MPWLTWAVRKRLARYFRDSRSTSINRVLIHVRMRPKSQSTQSLSSLASTSRLNLVGASPCVVIFASAFSTLAGVGSLLFIARLHVADLLKGGFNPLPFGKNC